METIGMGTTGLQGLRIMFTTQLEYSKAYHITFIGTKYFLKLVCSIANEYAWLFSALL